MLKIVFRVDANHQIGGGHLMRSLRLLSAFKKQNVETVLITERTTADDFPELIASFNEVVLIDDAKDIQVFETALFGVSAKAHVDAIIFDHYELGEQHEECAKKYVSRVIALDDLERPHAAHLLFHYNQFLDDAAMDFVGGRCDLLLNDSCYFPIDEAFLNVSPWAHCSCISNVFISFGYDDPKLFTAKILEALRPIPKKIKAFVVLSPRLQSEIQDVIDRFKGCHEVEFFYALNADDLASVMSMCDFAIGAGGGNIYERAVLGLPSMVYEYADNQKPNIDYFERSCAIYNAGRIDEFSSKNFLEMFTSLTQNENMLNELSDHNIGILGGEPRCYLDSFLCSYVGGDLSLRQARMEDSNFIYGLQDAETRKFYKNVEPPTMTEHENYMQKRIRNPMSFFIVSYKGQDAGFLRFDNVGDDCEVSVAIGKEFRGKGLALKALEQGLSLFPCREIYAYIHSENEASIKLFEGLKFKNKEQQGQFIKFIKDN